MVPRAGPRRTLPPAARRVERMDTEQRRQALEGCYVTVPTPFADREGWPIDDSALRTYVRFLVDNGLHGDRATLLAGGAAGDFSTMTFDERVHVASVVIEEADGRVPVAMGAQTTSTLELIRLARAAQSLGADFIQVSCPFYFEHGEGDFEEFVREAAAAGRAGGRNHRLQHVLDVDRTSRSRMVERLADIANVVGLKWANAAHRRDGVRGRDLALLRPLHDHRQQPLLRLQPDAGARAQGHSRCIFATSGRSGASGSSTKCGRATIAEIARMMVEEAMPFYKLWVEHRARVHERRRLPRQTLHGARSASRRAAAAPRRATSANGYRSRARAMLRGDRMSAARRSGTQGTAHDEPAGSRA